MPAILTDQLACATQVPIAWRDVIVDVEKFLEIERDLRVHQVDVSSTRIPPVMLTLHARLMNRSMALLEPEALADLTPRANSQLFARATLMLTYLSQCVAADEAQRLDTAGSRILGNIQSDFQASADNLRRLRTALARMPELSREDLAEIEAVVDQDLDDARRKQQIVKALREEFQLWADAPDLRNNIWRFFTTFHPDTGLRPDEVELIVTGCLIFFCIPYSGTSLLTERFRTAQPEEQAPVRRFLMRISRFAHRQFAHFPVFGFLRGTDLPQALLARVAHAARLSTAEVAAEISRLTAVVPLNEVDKYVPHDVWGHSWQASMLHYDDFYAELATYADPLPFDHQVTTPAGQVVRWQDCFSINDGQVHLRETLFRDFALGLVLQRLAISLTPVIAELIADIAEFQFLELEPQRADELPNSSLLQSFPAKLDLMLQDVFFYFRQASKVLRLWAQSCSRQRQTIEALGRHGASQSAAEIAVAQAVEVWQQLESGLLAPNMIWTTHDNRLEVNVVTRVVLNFLGIHRSTLETYERIRGIDVGELPLRSFRDLLLLSAAVFFEADPPRNLCALMNSSRCGSCPGVRRLRKLAATNWQPVYEEAHSCQHCQLRTGHPQPQPSNSWAGPARPLSVPPPAALLRHASRFSAPRQFGSPRSVPTGHPREKQIRHPSRPGRVVDCRWQLESSAPRLAAIDDVQNQQGVKRRNKRVAIHI